MSLARAHLLIFGIMALDFLMMLLYPIPKLISAAGGLLPFDLRITGYTPADAARYLAALTDDDRLLYLQVQLRLDMFFPALLAVTLMLALYRLAPKWPVLYLFPISGALFDYYENAAIEQILLSNSAEPGLIGAASLLTGLKFASVALSLLAILWFWRKGKADG